MKNNLKPSAGFLKSMAKQEKAPQWRTGNIIVNYTRVSDPAQLDNTSLETQQKDAIVYAHNRGYNIKEFFGGIVESAKTDERKEFKRMLDYVKKDKSVSAILVYSYERFSRSENAIQLTTELRKLGVKVLSVIQELDVTSPNGQFQQSIYYAFGKYDNDLRRQKSMRGMVENLLNGYWVGACPFGYTNLKRKEKAKYHEYVINEEGKLLKLGFKWKAEGTLTNKEIVDKLQIMGCRINYKSFVRTISNPFYCGFITHSLIPGEVVKGNHPPLVSVELFQKANNIVDANPHKGIPKKFKIEELPLKSFAKDEESLSPFTGYTQKGQWYYKTRDKGTKVNQNAKIVHEAFLSELSKMEPRIKDAKKLESLVITFVKDKLAERLGNQEEIKKQISLLKSKINQLEVRYVENDLEKELYLKYRKLYDDELKKMEQEIGKTVITSSNLEIAVQKGISISQNLSRLWLSSDYSDKQRLQYLVYPEGILYNKKNNTVRIPRVNSIFSAIAYLSSVSAKNKNGQPHLVDQNSRWVVPTGIEPVSKV